MFNNHHFAKRLSVIVNFMTRDFSTEGASLLAPYEKEQEHLLMACPEMLVACMFAQQIIGNNKHLVLFEGITKFNAENSFFNVARNWDVCSDGTNYDKSKNLCIALKQYLKTGVFSQDRWSGITKFILILNLRHVCYFHKLRG
jgi:hypothetical protein